MPGSSCYLEAKLLLVEKSLVWREIKCPSVSLRGLWGRSAFPVLVIWLGAQAEPASACLRPAGMNPKLPVSLSLPGLVRARAGEIGQIQGENIAKSVLGLCLI